VGGALAGLAAALYVPALRIVFRFDALSSSDLLLGLAAASAGILWSETVN
jgi:hypothetical protein